MGFAVLAPDPVLAPVPALDLDPDPALVPALDPVPAPGMARLGLAARLPPLGLPDEHSSQQHSLPREEREKETHCHCCCCCH